MSFLASDETIVIMDVCPECMGTSCRHISYEHLRRLRDCGVRTVLEYVAWNSIEQEMGVRDWGHLDGYIERARRAGMKILLSTPHFVPACFPDEWYPWDRGMRAMKGNSTGQAQCVLSIFNDEALAYELEFIREIRARYEAPDVMLFCSQQVEGETVYQNNWAYGEPAAQQAWKRENSWNTMDYPLIDEWLARRYVEALVRLQGAFLSGRAQQEIWSALHPLLSETVRPECRGNGCRWIERYFEAYRAAFPGVELTWLQYTYFPHAPEHQRRVRETAERHGLNLVVGAEWVTGLRVNHPQAMEEGLRLLVGVQHPISGYTVMEGWMFEVIREAVEKMSAARRGEREITESRKWHTKI